MTNSIVNTIANQRVYDNIKSAIAHMRIAPALILKDFCVRKCLKRVISSHNLPWR